MAVPAANQPPEEAPRERAQTPPPEQSGTSAPKPGLDPDPNPKVVVRAINPPVTPDQVVSQAETPAVTLPEIKLEKIRVPRVQNKSIQGYLKAIEAKMTATEKLMKDVVKLQNLQIVTEKELHERKRELYQNTFEEYLLDKTVGFDDEDNPDCTCINLPKKPGGGFPFAGGRKRRRGGGGGGIPPVIPPLPDAEAEEAANADKATDEAEGLGTRDFGDNYAEKEREAFRKAQEFEKRKQQETKVAPKGVPVPEELEPEEAEPTTPMVEPGVPLPVPVILPGIKPAPIFIPDTIRQAGTPAVPPVITLPPKYDVTTAEGKSILAGDILEYVENNPGSDLDRKLGLGARVDTGHLIKKKDGEVYIHEPLTEGQQTLLGASNWLNLSGWMPIVPLRTGRSSTTVTGTSRVRQPVRQPANNKVPTRRAQPAPVPQPVSAQPVSAQTPVTGLGRPLGGAKQVIAAGSRRSSPIEDQFRVDRQIMEAELMGSNPNFMGQLMGDGLNLSGYSPQKFDPNVMSNLMKGVLPQPQASGGINNMNLYESSSKQYFKKVSNNMKIPNFGGGGVVDWWNKGRNMRVPNENTARWRGPDGLMADDAKQLTRTNKAFKSGATGVRGWNPFKAFTPEMVKTGPTPAVRQAFERPVRAVRGAVKPGHPLVMLAELIINELVNPQSTAVYDQVTGPNAYFNAPGYDGPMPSQNLETAQTNMMQSDNNSTPQVVPLPPDYIKLPGKKPKKQEVGFDVPGIDVEASPFGRSTTFIDPSFGSRF